MNSVATRVAIALIAVATYSTQKLDRTPPKDAPKAAQSPAISSAVSKGAAWLASTQGADGGWGQDGDGSSNRSTQQNLESTGNDVANTAVAALALLRAGRQYRPNVERAVDFILRRIEASPAAGLAITDQQNTQIQRKLGPYIDTFLASMLLARVDGTLAQVRQNSRVRLALEKCVAKIEKNQAGDGSWNSAGGWAPVLGTSLASRSLYEAEQKGVRVNQQVKDKAESYTANAMKSPSGAPTGAEMRPSSAVSLGGTGAGAGIGMGAGRGGGTSESAGVNLYQQAQAMEQLSRTDALRTRNAKQLEQIQGNLSDAKFVDGFGSIGGEEFFSYLNLSEGMKRTGGETWKKWHEGITAKILNLQNADGTWAGHHCITGRVAVTSAAILNLTIDREQL